MEDLETQLCEANIETVDGGMDGGMEWRVPLWIFVLNYREPNLTFSEVFIPFSYVEDVRNVGGRARNMSSTHTAGSRNMAGAWSSEFIKVDCRILGSNTPWWPITLAWWQLVPLSINDSRQLLATLITNHSTSSSSSSILLVSVH